MVSNAREKGSIEEEGERVGGMEGRKEETNLDLRSSNPTNGGKIVLHEKMVGLVVESPLTDDEVGSGVFDPVDEQREDARRRRGSAQPRPPSLPPPTTTSLSSRPSTPTQERRTRKNPTHILIISSNFSLS